MTSERPPEKLIEAVNSGRRVFWWVGVAVFGLGVCLGAFLALAVVLGEEVDGVVTAMEWERGTQGRAARYPVVEFRNTGSLRPIHQRISLGVVGNQHFVGQQLSLKYWPATGLLLINTFWNIWCFPIILCFAGLVSFGVSKLLASIDQRPQQQPPA